MNAAAGAALLCPFDSLLSRRDNHGLLPCILHVSLPVAKAALAASIMNAEPTTCQQDHRTHSSSFGMPTARSDCRNGDRSVFARSRTEHNGGLAVDRRVRQAGGDRSEVKAVGVCWRSSLMTGTAGTRAHPTPPLVNCWSPSRFVGTPDQDHARNHH